MFILQYPPFEPRIRQQGTLNLVWDSIRRKWVVLTPEEWVRQHFIHYLRQVKGYPSALLAVEKNISLGELNKRFDIVAYSQDHRPYLLVECKEMNTPLSHHVLEQALRYNLAIQSKYLVITNGVECYAFAMKSGRLEALDGIPDFGV